MKNYHMTFISLFLVFNLNMSGLTIGEQLKQLNSNWNYHQQDAQMLGENRVFTSDRELIQLHLKLVEKTLREKYSSLLSKEQKKNRFLMLDVLHEYWIKGVFPKNTNHKVRTPYFIDVCGTACAVGQLIINSGHLATANKISRENNNGYIFDLTMKYPEINDWAKSYGFTIEELAWIQPCYNPPLDTAGLRHPTCHNAMNGYFCPDFSQMQVPMTKSFYCWVDTVWATWMDQCGHWRFNHLTAGKYKWQVKDGLNAMHTFSIELIAPAPATVTILKSGDFNSCNGLITASVQGGVSPFKYYWSGHTNTTSVLSSVCEESITLSFFEGGSLCPQYMQIQTSPVGLKENSLNSFSISPNPVHDVLHLNFDRSLSSEYITAKLFDAYGRVVLQVALKSELPTIDLSQIPSGLYFLQVENLKTQRILKE